MIDLTLSLKGASKVRAASPLQPLRVFRSATAAQILAPLGHNGVRPVALAARMAAFRPGEARVVAPQNPSRPSPPGGYASLDGTCRTSSWNDHLAGKNAGEWEKQAAAKRQTLAAKRSAVLAGAGHTAQDGVGWILKGSSGRRSREGRFWTPTSVCSQSSIALF